MAKIAELEAQLTAAFTNLPDKTSLKSLPALLSLASSVDTQIAYRAIFAFYRVGAVALASPLYNTTQNAQVAKITKWLDQIVDQFSASLIKNFQHHDVDLRLGALDISMALFKNRCENLHRRHLPPFHHKHLRLIVDAFLTTTPIPDMLQQFSMKWVNAYQDIRWLVMKQANSVLQDSSLDRDQVARSVLALLSLIKPMPSPPIFWLASIFNANNLDEAISPKDLPADDWKTFFDERAETGMHTSNIRLGRKMTVGLAGVVSSASLADQLATTWTLLVPSLAASSELSAQGLEVLSTSMELNKKLVLKLMDWISGSVAYGGSVGILALRLMYKLLVLFNLDYPDFYTRLYGYLDSNCFHSKHSSQFLRLLAEFLQSTHIPTNLLASFVKRLSRMSLTAPPSVLVVIIPLVYNTLHLHPQLMALIHNPANMITDPFDPEEVSPYTTNALSSSLWELVSLCNHQNGVVASLAQIFSGTFSRQPFVLNDFLDQSYNTLFRSEHKKIFRIDPIISPSIGSLSYFQWADFN
ncbi:CBF-domain-containing protein [Clavulina sp. PMI_390]|nr:CBF-domain-containing protein [Clavulina sp. PMI_390]